MSTGESANGALEIAAVGDIAITRALDGRSDAATVRELCAAGIVFGDLEVPLTDRGTRWDKIVSYRAAPERAADVRALGFDIVSLANNQTMNFGWPGLDDTMNALRRCGIRYAGAGRDADEAWAPVVMRAGGYDVAFLAMTCLAPSGWSAAAGRPGLAAVGVHTAYEVDARWEQEEPGVPPRVRTRVAPADLERACRAVDHARSEADIVIASVHWGVGSSAGRADYQAELGHALVDAGVTAVLGNHPPPLQGFEVYREALISYSQGTFVRQQPQATEDPRLDALYARMPRESCIVRLSVGRDGAISMTVVPSMLDDAGVSQIVSGTAARHVLDLVRRRSIGPAGRAEADGDRLTLTVRGARETLPESGSAEAAQNVPTNEIA